MAALLDDVAVAQHDGVVGIDHGAEPVADDDRGAPGARLPQVRERAGEIPRDRCVVVYCDSGYRASMGASLLQRAGFTRVANLPGSMQAWTGAGYPVEKG